MDKIVIRKNQPYQPVRPNNDADMARLDLLLTDAAATDDGRWTRIRGPYPKRSQIPTRNASQINTELTWRDWTRELNLWFRGWTDPDGHVWLIARPDHLDPEHKLKHRLYRERYAKRVNNQAKRDAWMEDHRERVREARKNDPSGSAKKYIK